VVEHLLSGLVGLKRGHERRFVEASVRRTAVLSGLLMTKPGGTAGQPRPHTLANNREEVFGFAGGARIVTDTYPAMIAGSPRSSPISGCSSSKRDRHDLVLRIPMRLYRTGNHCAYSMPAIFDYVRWYERMAEIWLAKLPSISLALNYEEVVAEPAAALGHATRRKPPAILWSPMMTAIAGKPTAA
jgi:hypothetical protein